MAAQFKFCWAGEFLIIILGCRKIPFLLEWRRLKLDTASDCSAKTCWMFFRAYITKQRTVKSHFRTEWHWKYGAPRFGNPAELWMDVYKQSHWCPRPRKDLFREKVNDGRSDPTFTSDQSLSLEYFTRKSGWDCEASRRQFRKFSRSIPNFYDTDRNILVRRFQLLSQHKMEARRRWRSDKKAPNANATVCKIVRRAPSFSPSPSVFPSPSRRSSLSYMRWKERCPHL